MFTKEQFFKAIQHETHICKHLFGKMPEGGLSYRPTPGQRSMLELLQYLTTTVIIPAQAIVSGDWVTIKDRIEKAQISSVDQFCAAMDRQCDETLALLKDISEDEMLTRQAQTPMGPFLLGEALVLFPLKFIVAYRMQLFLYLKAVDVEEIGTFNCWGGMDKPAGDQPIHG